MNSVATAVDRLTPFERDLCNWLGYVQCWDYLSESRRYHKRRMFAKRVAQIKMMLSFACVPLGIIIIF